MRCERANAKINLFLNITARRENGYHDIVSIMQTVSLCDLVTVEYMPSAHTSIQLSVSGNDQVPADCRNLAWRAAELFLQTLKRSGNVRIFIEKHIPMAGGMAGGSSDAAAVLRALNRLCGSPMTTGQLCEIGGRLGADIPFCIVGGASLVGGIGDRLEEIPSMPACYLVVASMGEGVSTPWAYGKLDERYENFSGEKSSGQVPDGVLSGMKAQHLQTCCTGFYNVFEEVVPETRPWVDTLKRTMLECGAITSMMSGSGPSVFGVFETAELAQKAAESLQSIGVKGFVCHPCAKYPI